MSTSPRTLDGLGYAVDALAATMRRHLCSADDMPVATLGAAIPPLLDELGRRRLGLSPCHDPAWTATTLRNAATMWSQRVDAHDSERRGPGGRPSAADDERARDWRAAVRLVGELLPLLDELQALRARQRGAL